MKSREKELLKLAYQAIHPVLIKPKLDSEFKEFNEANQQLNKFMNQMKDLDVKDITPELKALITFLKKEVDITINSPKFENESKKALEKKNKLQKSAAKAEKALDKAENPGFWSSPTPNDIESLKYEVDVTIGAVFSQKQEWFYYDNLERLQLQLRKLEKLVNAPPKEPEPEVPPPLESMEDMDYEIDLETLETTYFPSQPKSQTQSEKLIDPKEQKERIEKTEHVLQLFKESTKKDAKAMDLIYECYDQLKKSGKDASDDHALEFLTQIIIQYTSEILPLSEVWKKNMEEAKPIRVVAEVRQSSHFFSQAHSRTAEPKKEQQITEYEMALQSKVFRKLVKKLEEKNAIKTEKTSRHGLRVHSIKRE